MNKATIEVRDQDAAVFRHRLRERRDQLVATYDAGVRDKEHPDDLRSMIEDAHGAEALAQAALTGERLKFEGDARVLSDVADTMLRDAIAKAAELAQFAPVEYDALDQITDSISWWTATAKRIDAEYRAGEDARRKAAA